jgi:hypothetical protein
MSLRRSDPVGLGSAVVSTAVSGVPPETFQALDPAPIGLGVRLPGETPARATETVALPNPSESSRLRRAGFWDSGEARGRRISAVICNE